MADFRPDHHGIGELMRSPEMHAAVTDAAHDAIGYARSISPDAPPYGEGYVDSFGVDGGHTEKIAGTRRAVAYLYNDADHAIIVEVGTDQQAGHRVLSRVIDHIEST